MPHGRRYTARPGSRRRALFFAAARAIFHIIDASPSGQAAAISRDMLPAPDDRIKRADETTLGQPRHYA